MTISRKISKILVPLDGSANSFRGLDYAIFLAKQCNATITGFHVVPLGNPKPNESISDLERFLLSVATVFMKKAKTKATKSGVLFYDKLVYGDARSEIIKFLKRNTFDLIVIGSRGRGNAKEIFLGSTSNHVLHKSKIPVMVVK